MILVKNVTKQYHLNKEQQKNLQTKEKIKKAVHNLSFKAVPGEIYGLLGTNGAGKTTTLRCIATLLNPTEGTIEVCGLDTVSYAIEVRKKIGFLTTDIKLEPQFTPNYIVEFFGKLYGVERQQLQERKEELFSYFDIKEFQNKKICELSTGMKQKVSIVVSLLHNPEVIIFDEPTNGLDIVMVKKVLDYLKILKERGKTIIISTHELAQAEKLCDRIGIIMDGEMIITGTLEEICEKTGENNLEDSFFTLYEMNGRGGEKL